MMQLFKTIKAKVPDAILRTTLIAGFPGESAKDQAETLQFLKDVRFDHMGCFTYSREEGTAAYSFSHQIPEKTKQARYGELMATRAGGTISCHCGPHCLGILYINDGPHA